MYPSHIITKAKTFVHENILSSQYDETELIRFLNDGVKVLVAEARDKFPTFGMITTNVTQTSGTETTSLPGRLDRIIQMRDDNDDHERSNGVNFSSILDEGYALTDADFYWVNSDQTNTWELYYTRIPADVHYGLAGTISATTMVLATNGAATTYGDVWTGSQYDDYYNGTQIYIRDCTTAAGENQIATITDYDGLTGVATVASWPSGTTPDGDITYELLPALDCEEFSTLLAWEVALRVLITSRDNEIVMARYHPYKSERKKFKAKWAKRQKSTNPHVRFRALESQT